MRAKEWADVVAAIRRLVEFGQSDGRNHREPGETSQPVADAATVQAYVLDAIEDGQPFGFTWDMVGAIQFLVMDFAGDPMRGMTEAEASAEWRRMKELAEAAADRIAALLPPRES